MKRGFVLIIAILMVSAFSVFAGGQKEAPKPSQDSTAQAAVAPLRVAAIYATPIEEPWDGAIHVALLEAQKKLGIDYKWAENVGYSDFERVLREYADQNYQVIFGDAFGSEDAVRRVAKDYPKIAFVFGSGGGPQDPNLSVFDDWIQEPSYLCGMIAGSITKSNTIGVVGGIPVPEVNRIINAYIAGAREVNKNVKVKVAFIGSWFDPPKAKEAALSQIEQGADVLFAERYGVIDAAKERGIVAFGSLQDQHSLAPDTVITSPVWNVYPIVEHVLDSVKKNDFQAQDLKDWSMMGKGGAYLAPFYGFKDKLPASVLEMVDKRTKEIDSGLFRVDINEATPKSD
jgi:basic membrane lipoprotein Med (substrate-binding protein (PBP1-ABC) superfamily)